MGQHIPGLPVRTHSDAGRPFQGIGNVCFGKTLVARAPPGKYHLQIPLPALRRQLLKPHSLFL